MDQWSVQTAINEPWKIVGLNMFVLESYRAVRESYLPVTLTIGR